VNTLYKLTSYGIAVLSAFLLSTVATAGQPVAPDISAAFSYLSGQQQSDGSFSVSTPTTTNYHTTARVAQSLSQSFPGSAEFSLTQTFVSSNILSTNEDLARRLFVTNSAVDLSVIQASQNADGGYGAETGFSSNVLDTAIVVAAMKSAGAPVGAAGSNVIIPAGGAHVVTVEVPTDVLSMNILIESVTGSVEVRIAEGAEPGAAGLFFTVSTGNTFITLTPTTSPSLLPGTNFIKFSAPAGATLSFSVNYATPTETTDAATGALQYLLMAQNTDGGWGFQSKDDDSRLYYSYWAVKALGNRIDTTAQTAYVLANEQAGGGFSDSGPATVFDSAVGLLTLANSGSNSLAVAPDSVTFVESAQQINGSFGNDAFVTAWALDALLGVRSPIAPDITSNGGAGTGQNFITNLGVTTITGFAPVGTAGIAVNNPSAITTYDPTTGQYVITVNLSEGINTVQIAAFNLSGTLGDIISVQATRDSSLIGQNISLIQGLNQVGLALTPANGLSAQGLLSLLGVNATEVQQFNTVTGQYDSVKTDGFGGYTGSDFSLSGLAAINVIMSGASATSVVGDLVTAGTVNLQAGINALTIPNPPTSLDAFGLLALIGDETVVSSMQRFNPTSGQFETAIYSGNLTTGVNFAIESGIGYYVHMQVALTEFVLPDNIDVSVAISSPINGATITSSPLVVTGVASGAEPLTVTVNGVAAVVTGNNYTATLPLTGAGVIPITATVIDNVGASASSSINITYNFVDFVLPVGTNTSGIKSFFTTPAVITQVAFYTQAISGLPAGMTYTTDVFQLYGDGRVQVSYTIAASSTVVPGIYIFQVTYGLSDASSTPLAPLTDNVFTFKFEVVP